MCPPLLRLLAAQIFCWVDWKVPCTFLFEYLDAIWKRCCSFVVTQNSFSQQLVERWVHLVLILFLKARRICRVAGEVFCQFFAQIDSRWKLEVVSFSVDRESCFSQRPLKVTTAASAFLKRESRVCHMEVAVGFLDPKMDYKANGIHLFLV